MTPTVSQIWEKGVTPYQSGQINDTQLMGVTVEEIRRFLLYIPGKKNSITVFSMANYERPALEERRLFTC